MQKIILGFAGEMSCGKGTAAKYVVEKYAGSYHRFSTMLRDLARRMYIEENRDDLQKISTFFRQNFGEDIMSKVIYSDVKNDNNEIIVVDGVRRIMDIRYLKDLPGFKLVYIEAEMAKRYERIVKRGENTDDAIKTFEEFKQDHKQESELQIKDLKKQADFVVDNNGTTEELYAQIDAIIKEC
ncbi:MAG: hypothetical protein CO141_00770 [Candidatus Moranbacteria bacterium CG_4_9_14_3_um_filter_42_9]|nr:MAG: hypothetical protein CO141_00770 [Candidatus Moranbacteria bacterium CG_4_9_14_3_um_filter_42_9]